MTTFSRDILHASPRFARVLKTTRYAYAGEHYARPSILARGSFWIGMTVALAGLALLCVVVGVGA